MPVKRFDTPPPRLLDVEGPAGDCVREALESHDLPPPVPRFVELRDKGVRRVRVQRGALFVLLGAAALLLAALVVSADERPLGG